MSFEQTRQIVEARVFKVNITTQTGFEITFSDNTIGGVFDFFRITFGDVTDKFYTAQGSFVNFVKGFNTGTGWQNTGSNSAFICNPRTSDVAEMVAALVIGFNNGDLISQSNPPDAVRTDELLYEARVKPGASNTTTMQFFKKDSSDVVSTPVLSTPSAGREWDNIVVSSTIKESAIDEARNYPYSTTSKESPADEARVNTISSSGRIITAAADASGIFKEVDRYTIFRDGQSFKQPTDVPFIVLFINDADNRVTSFAGDLNKTGGVIRFRINVPRSSSNPVRIARLIADAINIRIGFSGGSSTTDINRYPTGNVGGTLYNDRGILNRISDNDAGTLVYTLDFLYTYYN